MTITTFDLRYFMEKAGDKIPARPTLLNAEDEHNCQEVIKEEFVELLEAAKHGDIENIAKECADVIYSTMWYALLHGIPITQVFKAVAENNSTKVKKEVIRGKHNKIQKPDDYEPVDLKLILGIKK